jgi:hypothetical protein
MENLICIPFARLGGPAPYADSICLTQAQWDALSANELIVMQNERYEAWIALLETPPEEPEGEE